MLRTASSLFTPHPSLNTRAHLHTSLPRSLDVSGIIGPDNVVRSPLPDIDLPKEDLYTYVYKDFAKYGSKVALVHGETGRVLSHSYSTVPLLLLSHSYCPTSISTVPLLYYCPTPTVPLLLVLSHSYCPTPISTVPLLLLSHSY